ncbi:MAG: DUF4906 domain-containing protein [Alistipes sp.]|uniref:fimbrial protein n=1 Tax=Alistipes sp. TaxID=1872444 RepID=UPI0025C3F207|nr:fimbrial protein [Alistipes sp.]MCD8275798.1 DUF4906 domain-containing protein [Alistipes sp.]
MNKVSYRTLLYSAVFLLFALVSCSEEEELFDNRLSGSACGELVLRAVSQQMLEQQVTTRASEIKNTEEQKINQLYLFFFDEEGNYIGSRNPALFNGYWTPGSGAASISIAQDALPAGETVMARVYAIANVEPNTFLDDDKDGFPDNIGKESDLKDFVYRPRGETTRSIAELPDEGMPMFGQWKSENGDTDLLDLKSSGSVTIAMKALMARIDVDIRLRSEQVSADGTLPQLTLNSWSVTNLPTCVPFMLPASGVSDLGSSKRDEQEDRTYVIGNGESESISISFYMFENLQEPQPDAETGKLPGEYVYPEELESEDDKQRWKPCFASSDAAAFTMSGYYTTYTTAAASNPTYEADFTFYLGANHTDNFKVARNRHYQNSIYIQGLTYVGNNPEHVNFDACVDVAEQENPFYISMLRTYEHDAHFNITPMDIFLFRRDASPQVQVTIKDAADKPWIRMERIKAEYMSQGTVPDGDNSNSSGSKYIAAGKAWSAGNGIRRYFTTTLMSDLADNTSYMVEDHRDRIYFYLDENIGTSDRMADIEIVYTDNTGDSRTRTIRITQHGLLKVEVYEDNINKTNLLQTIYIEQFEEYRNYSDPLSEFDDNQKFKGLRWGDPGVYMHGGGPWSLNTEWVDVYTNGIEATNNIVRRYGQKVMSLRESPESAAEYCYNKNKRNPVSHEVDDTRWFLPGIRQLEAILTTYYNRYPEFRDDFYWSSAAGKRKRTILYYEDDDYARATRAFDKITQVTDDGDEWNKNTWFNYAPSDWNNIYDGIYRGKAPRGESLRIRAAYIPAEGKVVE